MKDSFARYISENSGLIQTKSVEENIVVSVTRPWGDGDMKEVSIKLSEEEWEDYYEGAAEVDKYPYSLMLIHLEEALASAMNTNMKNVSIIYDGTFAPQGIYYTPPQT